MSAAEAWAAGVAGAVVLFVCVYLTLLMRALRNERVIAMALAAMHDALDEDPPPQRVLLSAVADTLMAQEQAAGRIEVAVHELALRGRPVPEPEELLTELLALPEPQQLVAEFLEKHGGTTRSAATFTSVAANLIRAATGEAFRDLACPGGARNQVRLERLLLLAAEGRIAPVALAGLAVPPDPDAPPYWAPRVADVDPLAIARIAQNLDDTVRRYLRLATLLHGQAEAILRVRRVAKQPRLAALRARVLDFMRNPLRVGLSSGPVISGTWRSPSTRSARWLTPLRSCVPRAGTPRPCSCWPDCGFRCQPGCPGACITRNLWRRCGPWLPSESGTGSLYHDGWPPH